MELLPQQIEAYNSQGYLVIPHSMHSIFAAEDLQDWAAQVKSWPRESGKAMQYDEINASGERQLMRTEYFADFHPQLADILHGNIFKDLLKQLSGQDVLFKNKINYKASKGNGFAPHLDAPAYDQVGKIQHITINVAVNESTKENGYLEVVHGSHLMNVPLKDRKIEEDWVNQQEWTPVPLQPGDLLIFGSYLAHRSGPNASVQPRASVYATYHSTEDGHDLRERYYIHRRIEFPPDHERVQGTDYEQGWKQYGFAAPFAPSSSTAVASK